MGDKANYHSLSVGYNKFFIDKRYINLKPCGDGSYGFVASAYDVISREKVAIKKIKDAFSDSIDAKRILREMKLLRHFNSHENIISIFDIMTVPPDTQHFNDIYIVTNLMESDLERIIRSRQVLTDQHFQYFLYQILRSLKYVHSANVLHRDLKPSNILVNANCDLAVCDFGLARGFHIEGQDTLTEYVVTRWYRAPELLCESPHYGKGVDIWSVGCIFAELLTHDAFFRGENPQHQLEVIVSKIGCPPPEKLIFISSAAAMSSILNYRNRQPKPFASYFPAGTSLLALDLISKMLQFHPDDRISVEHALDHPYLAEYHIQMPEPVCLNLFNFEFEKVNYDLSSEDVQQLMYQEMLLYRPNSVHFSSNEKDGNMDLAECRSAASSVCSESTLGSEETCKQGAISAGKSKSKSRSMKTRDEKDHGDYEKRDTKDGCVGYGVVNREALDSLNRMSGKGSGHSTLSDYMGMSDSASSGHGHHESDSKLEKHMIGMAEESHGESHHDLSSHSGTHGNESLAGNCDSMGFGNMESMSIDDAHFSDLKYVISSNEGNVMPNAFHQQKDFK